MKRTEQTHTTWTRTASPFGDLMRTYVGSTGCQAMVTDEPDGLHISVSAPGRYPTWDELASARDTFGRPDQRFVMHFPPHDEYANLHQTTLHLWEVRP